jgi:multicomponent Na+:H+ antiporter subunit G
MIDLLAAVFVVAGSLLMPLAAVGLIRMPDVYVRLQASTKAASLGAGCLLLALALHFNELAVTVRAMLAIAFIFLTVPVSGHMIGRAAYLVGVELWERTQWDELRDRYDPQTHQPASPAPGELGALPTLAEERELVDLLREGRSDREIADILGIPAGLVAARLDALQSRRHAQSREEMIDPPS